MAKAKKQRPLERTISGLQSEINALREEIRSLSNIIARVVSPVEAMEDLTGELRALRQLLDKDGKYAFVDSQREKERVKKEREARQAQPTAAGGKPNDVASGGGE